MTKELKALLPCPFCGSAVSPEVDQQGNKDGTWITVVCNWLNQGCGGSGAHHSTEARAIAAWNRRSTAPADGRGVPKGWRLVERGRCVTVKAPEYSGEVYCYDEPSSSVAEITLARLARCLLATPPSALPAAPERAPIGIDDSVSLGEFCRPEEEEDPPAAADVVPVYDALYALCLRIEACGASPALTHAVTLASDLMRAVGNQFNPADKYAADRVRDALAAQGESNG